MRSSAALSSAKAGDNNAVEANAMMTSKRFILIYLEPSIENLPGKYQHGKTQPSASQSRAGTADPRAILAEPLRKARGTRGRPGASRPQAEPPCRSS